MKDLTITSVIKVYEYDELNDTDRALLDDAIEATRRSYAPYSHFSVGAAALLANGVVVTEPIRRMQPIRPDSVPNAPRYFMPTRSIPTKLW